MNATKPSLRFVLDGHLRGTFLRAVRQNNRNTGFAIDVTQVGDPKELPLSSTNAEIIRWAAREERIIVTLDGRTMATCLQDHLSKGYSSPA